MRVYLLQILLILSMGGYAQTSAIYGKVYNSSGEAIASASISITKSGFNTSTDTLGYYNFNNLNVGKVTLKASVIGYQPSLISINLKINKVDTVNFELIENGFNSLNKVLPIVRTPAKVNLI